MSTKDEEPESEEYVKVIGNEILFYAHVDRENALDFVEKFSPNSLIFTDKAPLNFIWIGVIKILIPNSKIVHCVRNSKDNILSLVLRLPLWK